MPRGKPFTDRVTPALRSSQHPLKSHPIEDHDASDPLSSPIHLSTLSSRHNSRDPSPFVHISGSEEGGLSSVSGPATQKGVVPDSDSESDDWDDDSNDNMPSDLRPGLHRHSEGRSQQPLLTHKDEDEDYGSPTRPVISRRSTFHERDPESEAKYATRKRYTYAAGFLVLSLVSFAIQTETAVHIQQNLGWNKAYCMLYLTHGSWSLLWPTQLLILRLQKRNVPWGTFWRRHVEGLRQTAQMVQHQTLYPVGQAAAISPIPHMLKMTAVVTCALTIAGGSWYVAVDWTTASDLSAIYNCSAFFAYAFSVPLLKEKIRTSKVIAVAVAIVGVLIVAYGGSVPLKHGSKSGGGSGGGGSKDPAEASNRALGNLVIGIGSVLYGLYEVLYKRLMCPPDGCSPGRGMIFANTVGSLIGCFTLFVLWIPLPILHFTGIEKFGLPSGQAAWIMLISVLANATFSGSFLILISLTSPVLSSVAALLTIFIVALMDQFLPPPLYHPLSPAAIVGGLLIICAFLLLSWATYKEMGEERRRKMADEVEESDIDE